MAVSELRRCQAVAALQWSGYLPVWLGEQLINDDVVQVVGRPRLVLRPGRSFLGVDRPRVHWWTFRIRPRGLFASQELARRFHDEWASTG